MTTANPLKKSLGQFLNQEHVSGIVCTLPFSLGFILFLIVPMLISACYSLCDFDILSAPQWIGFDHYVKLFTGDPKFAKSIGVTFYFAFVSVPLRLVFALAVAMVLKRTTKLTPFYRAAYYLPSIIGGFVAVAILWKRMFAINGTVNMILQSLNINSHFAWLGNNGTAIWTLIILAVWQFGSSVLIFLASLKQIPNGLYEAARVDGAGPPSQFFKITLPLLTPTIFFYLVIQMINGFLAFTQRYIITQGKPLNSTLFYVVYMYQQSFEFYNTGYASAMAWVMLALIGIFTAILFLTKKFWVYDGGF